MTGTGDWQTWAGYATWLGLGLAVPFLLLEGWWPRAVPRVPLGRRWLANLLTFASSALVQQWLPGLSLIAVALLADERGWGLFQLIDAPATVAIVLAWLAIDLTGYLLHRAEHASPWLWRIHRVHHSDPDVDVTTTYRFHPFEVLLRSLVHAGVGLALGIPLVAAVIYLLASSVSSPLSHANVRLPALIEHLLGLLVITPGIHRTHHSLDAADSQSNYAVCLSCWDRLFRTFRASPRAGEGELRFGTPGRSPEQAVSIGRLLLDPFLGEKPGASPVLTQAATGRTIP